MIRGLFLAFIVIAVFGVLADSAYAQIAPFRGTLEYSTERGTWPNLTVNAANGSPAYIVSLKPQHDVAGNLVLIDLVLQRPHAKLDPSNLLEPPYRWHGLQAYGLNAVEFAQGEDSPFGMKRHIHIKSRKLDVDFAVINVKIIPTKPFPGSQGYAFTELALDVSVENAK